MNWIKECSIERQTMFSNGIIVQTDDCKRIKNFIDHMKEIYPEGLLMKIMSNPEPPKKPQHLPERLLILDGWEGLTEYKYDTMSKKFADSPDVLMDAMKYGGDLRQLLPIASKQLETERTIILVKNIFEPDKAFNRALRSWITSEKIRSVDSSVVVFVEDSNIFPESIWSKMKTIEVPKSLPEEREHLIKKSEISTYVPMNKRLKDAELKGAVRLLAGLDMDQNEAAIAEAIIRDYYIDLDRLASIKTNILGKDPALDIIQRPKYGFEAIGGYDALKQRLINDIVLPLKNPKYAEEFDMPSPRGVILFGPPGTGKTVLSKAMSKEVNMSMLVMRPENLLSKYVGESEKAVKRVFRIADNMAPVLLFMDEMDRLSKRASTAGSDGGAQVHREIFSMFLEKLGDENRKWFFIGCTNRIQDIDEAMRRTGRIDSIAPVPYPDEKAREKIFFIHACVKRHMPLADDIDFKVLADNQYTYMWSGSDIEQLVIRTARYVMNNSIKEGKTLPISMNDFQTILGTFNVDREGNQRLQEEMQSQAKQLTNDTRLMDVFKGAQKKVDGLTKTGNGGSRFRNIKRAQELDV